MLLCLGVATTFANWILADVFEAVVLVGYDKGVEVFFNNIGKDGFVGVGWRKACRVNRFSGWRGRIVGVVGQLGHDDGGDSKGDVKMKGYSN